MATQTDSQRNSKTFIELDDLPAAPREDVECSSTENSYHLSNGIVSSDTWGKCHYRVNGTESSHDSFILDPEENSSCPYPFSFLSECLYSNPNHKVDLDQDFQRSTTWISESLHPSHSVAMPEKHHPMHSIAVSEKLHPSHSVAVLETFHDRNEIDEVEALLEMHINVIDLDFF